MATAAAAGATPHVEGAVLHEAAAVDGGQAATAFGRQQASAAASSAVWIIRAIERVEAACREVVEQMQQLEGVRSILVDLASPCAFSRGVEEAGSAVSLAATAAKEKAADTAAAAAEVQPTPITGPTRIFFPLTSQALLPGTLMPAALPYLLHVGNDFFAACKPGETRCSSRRKTTPLRFPTTHTPPNTAATATAAAAAGTAAAAADTAAAAADTAAAAAADTAAAAAAPPGAAAAAEGCGVLGVLERRSRLLQEQLEALQRRLRSLKQQLALLQQLRNEEGDVQQVQQVAATEDAVDLRPVHAAQQSGGKVRRTPDGFVEIVEEYMSDEEGDAHMQKDQQQRQQVQQQQQQTVQQQQQKTEKTHQQQPEEGEHQEQQGKVGAMRQKEQQQRETQKTRQQKDEEKQEFITSGGMSVALEKKETQRATAAAAGVETYCSSTDATAATAETSLAHRKDSNVTVTASTVAEESRNCRHAREEHIPSASQDFSALITGSSVSEAGSSSSSSRREKDRGSSSSSSTASSSSSKTGDRAPHDRYGAFLESIAEAEKNQTLDIRFVKSMSPVSEVVERQVLSAARVSAEGEREEQQQECQSKGAPKQWQKKVQDDVSGSVQQQKEQQQELHSLKQPQIRDVYKEKQQQHEARTTANAAREEEKREEGNPLNPLGTPNKPSLFKQIREQQRQRQQQH